MTMNDVEGRGALKNSLQHHQVERSRVGVPAIQPDGPVAYRNQLRAGSRVAAGEQRDLMPLPDERLRKVGNHTLRPAVQLGRNTLEKRSYLCDSQGFFDDTHCP